jgi:hypothetical protein
VNAQCSRRTRHELFAAALGACVASKQELTQDELAVIEALGRDVAATVGLRDQAVFTNWLIAALRPGCAAARCRHCDSPTSSSRVD